MEVNQQKPLSPRNQRQSQPHAHELKENLQLKPPPPLQVPASPRGGRTSNAPLIPEQAQTHKAKRWASERKRKHVYSEVDTKRAWCYSLYVSSLRS